MLARWRALGLSMQRFARQQGVRVQRLHRWKQLLGAAVVKGFIEVPLPTPRSVTTTSVTTVEVILKKGAVVRVSDTASIALAVELINALEQHGSC